jgi:hypothetical protein
MREIVSPLDGFASPFGQRGGGRLADWFLASGEWDTAGLWVDRALWPLTWFLATGNWRADGYWVDGEAW